MFKDLNYEMIKNKFVDAEELVSMITAQIDENNADEVNLGARIIDLVFSHAITSKSIIAESTLETFEIKCAMGTSFDWKNLDITGEQHQFLNDIGYRGTEKMGYTYEEYLNEIHKDKYKYMVEHTSHSNSLFTDTYKISRVSFLAK